MDLSVVMAVYNGEKYIEEAIDSVLNQSYTGFEFIIVNDGSSDRTLAIIQSYNDPRIKVISHENVGHAKSLNIGIKAAKGKYIARLDADDRCHQERFSTQMDFLCNHPDLVLLGTNAHVIDDDGNFLYTSKLLQTIEKAEIFEDQNPFISSSVVFKMETYLKCGGYNEEIIHHFEDKLLWAEMFQYGKLANLDKALVDYRLTPYSASNKTKKLYRKQKEISNLYLKGKSLQKNELDQFLSLTKLSKRQKKSLYHNRIAGIYLTRHQNKRLAFQHLLQSIKVQPFNLGAIKLFLYSFLIKRASKNQNIQ